MAEKSTIARPYAKAIFELEMGFVADTGNNSIGGPSGVTPTPGPVFRRHSWVGLTGDWGTVVGGRVDGARYGVAVKYDPFQAGGVANMASLQVHASRADNAIAYITPNYEGLYAVLAYTSSLIGQEAAYNTGDLRLWVIQPNYVMGPVSVTLNYEHANAHNSTGDVKLNIYVFGAWYDFGVAKLTGYYEHVKTDSNPGCTGGALCDQTSWMVGGVVPVTENDNIRVSYVDYTDKSAAENTCRKFGVGGTHFLSKRTNLYLDFAHISYLHQSHQVGIDVVSEGIAQLPSSASLYLARGVLHVQLADYEKAEADFEKAHEVDPNQSLSVAAQGMAAVQANDLDRALETIQAKLASKPNDAYLLYLQADILSQRGAAPGTPEFQTAMRSASRPAGPNPEAPPTRARPTPAH